MAQNRRDRSHDASSLEAQAWTRHEELKRRAAPGERNLQHGAGTRGAPLWERFLGWMVLLAFIAFGAWFAVFIYRVVVG